MDNEIRDFITDEMVAFARQFVIDRKAFLRAKRISDGELVENFKFEVDLQARNEAMELFLNFPDYGRMLDMKPKVIAHDHYGRDYINRLEEWVKKKGIDGFIDGWIERHGQHLPRGLTPNGQNRLINAIAWGIAIKRSEGKFRKKPWWNKSKTVAITQFFNEVAAKLPDKTSDILTKSLTSNFNGKKYARAKGRE